MQMQDSSNTETFKYLAEKYGVLMDKRNIEEVLKRSYDSIRTSINEAERKAANSYELSEQELFHFNLGKTKRKLGRFVYFNTEQFAALIA